VVVISVAALADALIAAINPELPSGCWIARGTNDHWGGVWIEIFTAEGSWGGSGIAGLDETIAEERVPIAVEMTLDAIQDDVAHATQGIAWPPGGTGKHPLPSAWTTVTDGVLTFGYGETSFGAGVRLLDLTA
jgi:hypothetical protein